MDIEQHHNHGKWGIDEIIFNVVRNNIGASKFDYCVSYITHNCFGIIIICKCVNDIWGVAKLWVIIIGAMVRDAINITHKIEYEVSRAQRYWGPERLLKAMSILEIVCSHIFVAKAVGTSSRMHIGKNLSTYTQG